MRKFIALVLVLLLACSFCLSVFADGGSSRGAGAGRRLSTAKEYYTQPSDGNIYNTGDTSYYQVWNQANNTLNYNQTSINYNNYTWDEENNYYIFNVDNSSNYYVTENVTNVVVSYPVVSNETVTYETATLYYELPDGRNSFNLKAEDIWGTYFNYGVFNYTEVPEDDGVTLGLWHLDENFFDSSANQLGSITSSFYNFVETPFTSGLCLVGSTVTSKRISFPAFASSADFTFEFRIKIPSQLYSLGGSAPNYTPVPVTASSVYYSPFGVLKISLITGEWVSVSVVRLNGSLHCYVNGLEVEYFYGTTQYKVGSPFDYAVATTSFSFSNYGFNSYSSTAKSYYGDLVFDEIRLSSKALYTGSYTPSAQPFDTNSVMVLPDGGEEGYLAVKSNLPVSGYRIGGVRPTYPTSGYVYVYLENGVVKDIQQYQGNGWYSVDGAIYDSGSWVNLKDFSLEDYGADDTEPDPGPSPSPGPDDPEDPSGGSIWDKLVDAVLGFFKFIGNLIGLLLTGLIEFLSGAIEGLVGLVDLFGEFGAVLATLYTWMPAPWQTMLTGAFTIALLIGVLFLIFKKG